VEQHSLSLVQEFPNVWQFGLSAAQLPVTHLRLQQLSSEVQVWPSLLQLAPQVPFTQRTLQQSVSKVHDPPWGRQFGGPWHVPLLPHVPGPQQSDAIVHGCPGGWQFGGPTHMWLAVSQDSGMQQVELIVQL
jgi:hypothetical protein